MSNLSDDRVQTPKTLKDFGNALSRHLPSRLAQLRKLGKATKASSGNRPKK